MHGIYRRLGEIAQGVDLLAGLCDDTCIFSMFYQGLHGVGNEGVAGRGVTISIA